MFKSSKYHTAQENRIKHEALVEAVAQFVKDYQANSSFTSSPNMLYHHLDSLHALLTDLRRG